MTMATMWGEMNVYSRHQPEKVPFLIRGTGGLNVQVLAARMPVEERVLQQ